MRKIYTHDRHQHALIHRVLEMDLALWLETQKMNTAVGKAKKLRRPKWEAKHMATLQEALDKLGKSVNDSVAASDRLINKTKNSGTPPTPEQIEAVLTAAATLDAETANVNAAVDIPPTP